MLSSKTKHYHAFPIKTLTQKYVIDVIKSPLQKKSLNHINIH